MSDRERILREVYGDEDSWPSTANRTLPRGPGPQSLGEIEDAEEFRAKTRALRETERENADEQGMTVAEYRDFLAESERQDAARRSYWESGQGAADYRSRQREMRCQIGLPAGVLETAILSTANGSIGIRMPGDAMPWYGPFSVDAEGNLVVGA